MSMKKEVTSRTIASVISALIVAGIWWFWANISVFASGVGTWLTSTAAISYWFLLVWGGTTLVLLVFSALVIVRNAKLPIADQPAWYKFTSMHFNGFQWEWGWRDFRPVNMTPLCPSCKRIALHSEDDRWCRVQLRCTKCPQVEKTQDGTYSDIKRDLEIESELAVRTETWKQYTNHNRAA